MGRPLPVSLPIDPLLPGMVASLRARGAVVIEAPPGAGKTTRVPPALLDAGFGQRGEIVVLQPRRLPARLAAERVAGERGEKVGETVGYTVRFAEEASPRTRIRFVTEGILLRRLLGDAKLSGVEVVILDEFHERHLASDLALALLRRLQLNQRPDLSLVAMSATLDAHPVCEFLGDCPLVRSEGRLFEISLEHLPQPDARPLADQVASAVRRLCQEGLDGDVLVFLPGAAEIRRTAETLASLAETHELLLLPLHGDLSPAEQRRAVQPASRRKVILSTNVAETSVTIDGVVAVIDSGLARIASCSPWSGLPVLAVSKISQASAVQRAGRAGRTRPGRVLRLYTRLDFESRRPCHLPEIARLDLGRGPSDLGGLGRARRGEFRVVRAAGGVGGAGRARLAPSLGRSRWAGRAERHGPRDASLSGSSPPAAADRRGRAAGRGRGGGGAGRPGRRGRYQRQRANPPWGGTGSRAGATEGADLLERLDRFQQARAARFAGDRLRGLGVDGRAAEAAELARRQFAAALRREESVKRPTNPDVIDEALAMATLAAFPDRVMRRRSPGSNQALLASGGVADVGPLPPDDLLCAVDVEERTAAAARGGKPGGARTSGGWHPSRVAA